jgi:hypothetical protein
LERKSPSLERKSSSLERTSPELGEKVLKLGEKVPKLGEKVPKLGDEVLDDDRRTDHQLAEIPMRLLTKRQEEAPDAGAPRAGRYALALSAPS